MMLRRAPLLTMSMLVFASAMAAEPPVPGQRFELHVADLPAPFATESASNPSLIRPSRAAILAAPPGFVVNVFAEGLDHARNMVVLPDGTVFLAQPRLGEVSLLRDADGDGVADVIGPFVTGLLRPHGLALHGDYLYVADMDFVRRYDLRGPGVDGDILTAPGALGPPTGHWTRNLAIDEDGNLYVAVGSATNIGEEAPPRATVQMFDADGGNQRTLAAGLRNPVGITIHPQTRDLYVVVNERDGLGDGLAPDYFTRIRAGEFYGWPYAYAGGNPQPGFADRRPDLVAASRVPDLLFHSHSAPLGLVFYDADQFPQEYRGDAFVALHGSWNAAEPRGYMVARIPFADGRPQGWYQAFATNFWVGGRERAIVIGRPAGLVVAADGSLLIADDASGRIWRVAYAP